MAPASLATLFGGWPLPAGALLTRATEAAVLLWLARLGVLARLARLARSEGWLLVGGFVGSFERPLVRHRAPDTNTDEPEDNHDGHCPKHLAGARPR